MPSVATHLLAARWAVIANPEAGSGLVRTQLPLLEERLKALLPQCQFFLTTHSGHAIDLVAEAVQQGCTHLLAIGGDGTAHEVVNGMMLQPYIATEELVFALLPIGTGNDWIKTHGIPKEWAAWEAQFSAGSIARQNLARIQYTYPDGSTQIRYCLNVAGMAYDAFVVRALEQAPAVRWLPSKIKYLWAVLRSLFAYQPQLGKLSFEGQEVTQPFYTINIGPCRFSGGGMQFVPHAQPDAGTLALTYVRGISKLAVLLNSHRFYGGRIADFTPAVLTNVQKVELSHLETPIPIEADGEFLGYSPLTVEIAPRVLNFVI